MSEPYVHAPLPYESITFLALTCLPLPLGLSDPVARSSIRLALAAIDDHFGKSNRKKKPNNMGRKELVNGQKKPLSQNGRNNGLQAHKINKWALRKQMGLKEAGEREMANPWAVCDVEK